jgi:hypothetical protein
MHENGMGLTGSTALVQAALAKQSWVNTKGPGKGLRGEGRKGIAAIAEFSGGHA